MRLTDEHIIAPKREIILAPLLPKIYPMPKPPLKAYSATRDPPCDLKQNIIQFFY